MRVRLRVGFVFSGKCKGRAQRRRSARRSKKRRRSRARKSKLVEALVVCRLPTPSCGSSCGSSGDEEGVRPDGSIQLGPPPGAAAGQEADGGCGAAQALLEQSAVIAQQKKETKGQAKGAKKKPVGKAANKNKGKKKKDAAAAPKAFSKRQAESKLAADRQRNAQLSVKIAAAQAKLASQDQWWNKAQQSLAHMQKLIARSKRTRQDIAAARRTAEAQQQVVKQKVQRDVLERDLRVAKFVAAKVGQQFVSAYNTRQELNHRAASIAQRISRTRTRLLKAIENYKQVSEAGAP